MLDPLCPDCPLLARGAQPACWTCERVAWTEDLQEAAELHRLLELGMSWELALIVLGWTGTRDELRALAHRIETLRTLAPKEGPRG